jgi:hypothetical protein
MAVPAFPALPNIKDHNNQLLLKPTNQVTSITITLTHTLQTITIHQHISLTTFHPTTTTTTTTTTTPTLCCTTTRNHHHNNYPHNTHMANFINVHNNLTHRGIIQISQQPFLEPRAELFLQCKVPHILSLDCLSLGFVT